MKVGELIAKLQSFNPESTVHAGYDGDVVCTRVSDAQQIETEAQIGDCWWRVKIGDVVLLSEKGYL